jgi:hypothetical protein
VTLPSFQFAARRLRVLLRGVFHFKFATVLSVSKLRGKARTFARVAVRPAGGTEPATLRAASQTHGQSRQQALLRQIRHVEPIAGQDVTLSERIDVAPVRGVEPFIHVDVDLKIHVFEARIALAMDPRVDGTFDDEHSVRLPELEFYPNRLWKLQPLKRLDRHLVGDRHDLAAAREEPADVNLVRTFHKDQCAAA